MIGSTQSNNSIRGVWSKELLSAFIPPPRKADLVTNNPSAVNRSQKASAGELQAVAHHGGSVQVSRSSFSRTEAPAIWVSVVRLMRLIKTVEVDLDEATAHLWMRTPALRSIDQDRPAG